MKRAPWAITAAAILAFGAACAPADDDAKKDDASTEAVDLATCGPDNEALVESGKLTIATDDPAYSPWFVDDDPSNGKGFEGAVAYAVADKLGFDAADVVWTKAGFNQAVQPGTKNFDFDINQFSITEERAKAVDFSSPYYSAAQAVIVLNDNKFADAASLADLADAKIGAQVGTTSLEAVAQIGEDVEPLVYDDTSKAAQALQNKQVDVIIADLPTAFYLTSAELDDAKILGQFQPRTGESEQFGLLLSKGSAYTACVTAAVDALREDGTLQKIEDEWLSEAAEAPVIK